MRINKHAQATLVETKVPVVSPEIVTSHWYISNMACLRYYHKYATAALGALLAALLTFYIRYSIACLRL